MIRVRIHRVASVAMLLAVSFVLWRGERLKTTGTLDGEPFSTFAAVLVLASLVTTRGTARLYWISFVLIVVASTRNVLLIALGMALVTIGVAGTRGWGAAFVLASSLVLLRGVDLALLQEPSSWGIAVLALGLLAAWLAVHRASFTRDVYEPAESVHLSFSAAVAAVFALLRLSGWFPELAGLQWVLSAGAVFGLVLGALGVFFAEDRRNLARWGMLSQVGLLCLFVLGGVLSRPHVMAQLVVSGVALYAAAHARDRAYLLVGTVGLFSPPPFPGFAFKLGAASRVIAEGHGELLGLLLPAFLLLGVGAARFSWRPNEREHGFEPVSLSALAFAASSSVLLGFWPEPLLRLASFAASSLF